MSSGELAPPVMVTVSRWPSHSALDGRLRFGRPKLLWPKLLAVRVWPLLLDDSNTEVSASICRPVKFFFITKFTTPATASEP